MMIDQQYTTDREKLQKIRLLMVGQVELMVYSENCMRFFPLSVFLYCPLQAKRNREIAILQRKIDEVPNRAELTQYQKRFIELYSQGACLCFNVGMIYFLNACFILTYLFHLYVTTQKERSLATSITLRI